MWNFFLGNYKQIHLSHCDITLHVLDLLLYVEQANLFKVPRLQLYFDVNIVQV